VRRRRFRVEYLAALVFAVLGFNTLRPGTAITPVPTVAPSSADPAIPRASEPGALNPDVTQATIGSTVCVAGWTRTVRPPSSWTRPIEERLLVEYGYAGTPDDYELDHRVPLAVGGAPRDLRNLWPESWDGPTGARAKDTIERRVHDRVCSGRLTLAEGQAVFLGDFWHDPRGQR
jgi:hypothetical protein